MEEFIIRYGLLAVFLGAMVEEGVVLVLCGVIAHLRLIDLPLALSVAVAGRFTSDVILYTAGRLGSDKTKGLRIYRVVGPVVERIATRIGPWQIAGSSLLYGTRNVTMLFWGVRRLPFPRFALIDLPSCAAWAALLGTLGYCLSASATAVLGQVKRVELWLLGGVAVSVAVFLIIRIVAAKTRRTSGDHV